MTQMLTRDQLASDIVDKVMRELNMRSGFDHWWGGIDDTIQGEIRRDMTVEVEAVLQKAEIPSNIILRAE